MVHDIKARPAAVAAAMVRAGEEYDQNDRRQGERRAAPPAVDDDLLEVARTLCAVAARMGELTPQQLQYYPSPTREGSPVLLAARAACVRRGYTEDGLAVEGRIYPVAAPAPAVPAHQTSRAQRTNNEVSRDEVLAFMGRTQLSQHGVACLRDGEALLFDLDEFTKFANDLRATPAPAPAGGDAQAQDAARYRWLAGKVRKEGRDGGWTGYYVLPFILGWDDTPYSAKRGEGYHHKTLNEAIDAAMTPPVSSGVLNNNKD